MNIQKTIVYALQPLERYLKTDTHYILRNAFWLVAGSSIGMLIALLLSVAYARYLAKEAFGSYQYIFSIVSMIGVFSPGMNTALARSVARGFDGTFFKSAKIMFLFSLGISLICISTAIYFFLHDSKEIGWGLLIASLFVPFAEGLGNWVGYLDGKKEFKKKALCNVITQIFYGFGMIGAVTYIYVYHAPIALSVPLLVGTYFATHALPNIIFFSNIKKHIPPNAPEEKGTIRYGFHLSSSNIPAILAVYIDRILVYHFLGPAALAVYSFAILAPEQIKTLLKNIVTTTFPILASKISTPHEYAKLKKTMPQKIFRATLLSVLIVAGYNAAAPLLYNIFFPRYLEAIAFSQIFAFSLVLFPFSIFGNAVEIDGNIRKIYTHRITPPVLQIVLLLFLVPIFGLWGAIIGRVLGQLFGNMLSYILFRLP